MRLAYRLSGKKRGWAGHVSEDAGLDLRLSRARYHKIGEKKGIQKKQKRTNPDTLTVSSINTILKSHTVSECLNSLRHCPEIIPYISLSCASVYVQKPGMSLSVENETKQAEE